MLHETSKKNILHVKKTYKIHYSHSIEICEFNNF